MQQFTKGIGRLATLTAISLVLVGNTCAHVELLAPDGGEEFEAGTSVTISWQILVEHNTQNWDLWYSVTGDNGPWIPMVMNLPAGDTSAASIHTYAWTIPGTLSDQCRVRVLQDNSGTDYDDISDADFSIVAAPTLPEGRKLLDGFVAAGQLSDLFESDDQYYELDPNPTANPVKQKIHLILQSTSPTNTPGSFKFRLESAMMGGLSGDVIRRIELFNYNTGFPEQVDVRAAPNGDVSIDITPGGDLSRFVQPLTKEITAAVTWTSDSFAGATFAWSIDVDEAVWLVSD